MKTTQIAVYLNIALLLIGIMLSLSLPIKPYLWEGLGDPYDYLRQAKMPFFSSEFFCPARTAAHSPRPFTVPLFYKLVGSNPDAIIILQKLIHHFSAFLLIAAFLPFLQKMRTRLLWVVSMHSLSHWWHLSGWALLLLSESLATSLFFCWLASWLFYLHKPSWSRGFLHLLALILFSFTRDNWPYLLLPFYGLFTLFSFWWERQFLGLSISGLTTMLLIFFLQQAAADYGHRYRLPIMHNLLVRVMPHEEWWKWFEAQGMPQQALLKEKFGGLQSDDKKMFNLYGDETFRPFFDWVDHKGKSAYMRFLLTHPSYTLLSYEKPEQLQKISAYNLLYISESRGYSKKFDFIFPIFHWLWIFLILPFLFIAYFRSKLWIFAVLCFLLLVFLLHTLILYNADTYEVERHMFINQTIWHVICFATLFAGIEYWKNIRYGSKP